MELSRLSTTASFTKSGTTAHQIVTYVAGDGPILVRLGFELAVLLQVLIAFIWHPDLVPTPQPLDKESAPADTDAGSGRNIDQLRMFLEDAKLDAPEYKYLDKLVAAGTMYENLPSVEDSNLRHLGMTILAHRKRFLWRATKLSLGSK